MYPIEIREGILERLSTGESLRAICRDEGMPTETAVRKWARQDPEGFGSQYARARDLGLDALADEIIHISNTPLPGVIVTTKADGGVEEKRADMIEHRRLQVDARKWYLSKLAPKRYGDRTTLVGDPESPIESSLTVTFVGADRTA